MAEKNSEQIEDAEVQQDSNGRPLLDPLRLNPHASVLHRSGRGCRSSSAWAAGVQAPTVGDEQGHRAADE
jgi:hypothetical protein